MRRALVVVTGLLLAFLAALLLLCTLLMIEAARLPAATSLAWLQVLVLMLAETGTGVTAHTLIAGLTSVWVAAMALCLAPVGVIATLGEATHLRSVIWYSGATGGLTALGPTLARAVAERPASGTAAGYDARLGLIFFLTGLGGGFVYWAVAGRGVGRQSVET